MTALLDKVVLEVGPCLSWLQILLSSPFLPSGGDSCVDGFVYILGPCGSLQQTLLCWWEFLLPLQPPQIFTATGFEALFFWCQTPGLCGLYCSPLVPTGISAPECGTARTASCRLTTWSTSCCHATCPLHPGCPCLPLLPVWMNVSSLSSWLLNFHTIWFSGSSGCFLFLN